MKKIKTCLIILLFFQWAHVHAEEEALNEIGLKVKDVISEVKTVSNTNEFSKSIVSLGFLYKGQYVHFCTGTVVAHRKVLTAAHCVESIEGELDVKDVNSYISMYPGIKTGRVRKETYRRLIIQILDSSF